ncbi:hypothetical protein JTB14_026366 [Gonioctena quinquepunctata]|nr:hypothetical protein JTB14_026366 [Gonioctena quinquepunctata]
MSGIEISNKQLLNEIVKGNKELQLAIQAVKVKSVCKNWRNKSRLVKTEKETEELEKRVEFLERNQKKNSIIIFGLERKERYITPDSIIELLKNYLNIQLVGNDLITYTLLLKHIIVQ